MRHVLLVILILSLFAVSGCSAFYRDENGKLIWRDDLDSKEHVTRYYTCTQYGCYRD